MQRSSFNRLGGSGIGRDGVASGTQARGGEYGRQFVGLMGWTCLACMYMSYIIVSRNTVIATFSV